MIDHYATRFNMLQSLAVVPKKIATSLRGCRRAGANWRRWIEETPLADLRVWIHGASIGEALAAKPVLRLLRQRVPHPMTAIHTHTSPSVASWTGNIGADRCDYVPDPFGLKSVFARYQPNVMLYPRADLWPPLVTRAARAGAIQIIMGGSLSPGTSRLHWPTKAAYGRMLRRVSAVCSVSEADRSVWQALGAPSERIHPTGDTRDDEILDRIASPPINLRDWARNRAVLVAGSTHRLDTSLILNVLKRCRDRTSVVIVPHDPGPMAAREIQELASANEATPLFWRPNENIATDQQLVVVNERGLLRDLYGMATFAYVGGGFGRAGVHSVAEAAAAGIPVLVGPKGETDRLTHRFVEAGGASVVSSALEIEERLNEWLSDDKLRLEQGKRGRECVRPGASEMTVEVILRTLDGDSGSLAALND